MPKCEDCDEPVLFLKKPSGGWFPPVVPILDFAYGDHFIATAEGVGQAMPQVYKLHQCLTWEEKQLKNFEREQEKQRLIREDRERRAAAQRQQEEFERQQRELEEQEREEREKEERKKEQRRHAARVKRFEKDVEDTKALFARHHPNPRLLLSSCEDCGAESGECCRERDYGVVPNFDQLHMPSPYGWWNRQTACSYRYAVSPPDDRSRLTLPGRWGEDYDEEKCLGTTPDTVGPWPPSRPKPGRSYPAGSQYHADLAGHYDMAHWLRDNYLYVFEPEKVWLQPEEEATLTAWLAIYGDLFEIKEEVDGESEPGEVAGGRGVAGAEGVGGGHAEREGSPEAGGDRLDPEGQADPGAGDGEQANRGGTEWLRKLEQ